MSEKIKIYTDGACSGNPGKGGFGAVLLYKHHKKEISGFEKDTTNNRMELRAVIEALKIVKKSVSIVVYTDSKYVQNGISEWIHSWKKNGWKNASKKPIKNVDLWMALDLEAQKHRIEWKWVKGHNGDKYNEIADELARMALEKHR
ncbi:MAG TPA: ribonuclease HI [Rickettsiales bacterium]|nr:ribonuclease HI [Rickettsiales bacterium]